MGRHRSKHRTENPDASSPEAQGERIRYLREDVLGFLRPDFCEKFGIPKGTLQNWEDARYKGLRGSAVTRLISIFHEAGLEDVTTEWLLYGNGITPYKPRIENDKLTFASSKLSEDKIIATELQMFHQLNHNAVDLIVTDDSMLPCFLPGDYVAGKRFFDQEIQKALGKPCIVHTLEGQILLRIIDMGNQEELYTLTSINLKSPHSKPLSNIRILSAAPVLWVRRKDLT